jgi:hypothetical protein
MAEKADAIDERPQPMLDAEKEPTRVVPERVGDQISHEHLEQLAPNSDGDRAHLLEKINEMSEEEALDIITDAVQFFDDDWNFPGEMMERMKRLLQGPKVYGDFYDRDLRIDAVLLKWSSPYPGVRAVAEIRDSDVNPETFRAYFLGICVFTSHA